MYTETHLEKKKEGYVGFVLENFNGTVTWYAWSDNRILARIFYIELKQISIWEQNVENSET